jgi:hypothetical protein
MSVLTTRPSEGILFSGFLKACRESRAFMHMSDSCIKGFVISQMDKRFKIKKDKFIKAHSVTEDCPKCKGRGWFGRGRKPCPVCNGKKTITNAFPDRWKTNKSNNAWLFLKRPIIHNLLFGSIESTTQGRRLQRMLAAIESKECSYPEWINDVTLTGKSKGKESLIDLIKERFALYEIKPKWRHDAVQWYSARSLFAGDPLYIKLAPAMQRMARIYGATCPITGEYSKPENLLTSSGRFYDMHDTQLPSYSWGLSWPDKYYRSDNESIVSAVSKSGLKIIGASTRKAEAIFNESPPKEWVIADIMQKQLIPQAQKARMAA